VSFAAFILVKLRLSASSGESRIGKIIDRTLLKAENYLDRLTVHVRHVVGDPPRRVPNIFLALILKLREWCRDPGVIWNRPDDVPLLDSRDYQGQEAALNEIQARIVEQSSVVDETPSANYNRDSQTASSDSSTMEDATQLHHAESSATDSTVVPVDRMIPDWMGYAGQFNPAANGPTQTTIPLQAQSIMPGFAGMGFDETYYNMMENMDILAGGGLTGLEDWSIDANEFDNTMDTLNWQSSSNTGG
jgi:hypothetical protein